MARAVRSKKESGKSSPSVATATKPGVIVERPDLIPNVRQIFDQNFNNVDQLKGVLLALGKTQTGQATVASLLSGAGRRHRVIRRLGSTAEVKKYLCPVYEVSDHEIKSVLDS